ncbi:hypothetical protein K435DRAFT_865592 [Dendrothele bispora CBS 962.96]|uniref:Uncharacterized protein n=1 Tax=Dendrothele bispora (strain CBS 962.96) TaxID=1314807 RepID=A0A4S8LJ04_DENBC|nr:hypothetical protein K435DRAFT_865592 [Dendrothele bispora CBS 962.96]
MSKPLRLILYLFTRSFIHDSRLTDPTLASRKRALHVFASSLTIIVWEILTNSTEEYEMIARHKLPTPVYVLSQYESSPLLEVI